MEEVVSYANVMENCGVNEDRVYYRCLDSCELLLVVHASLRYGLMGKEYPPEVMNAYRANDNIWEIELCLG